MNRRNPGLPGDRRGPALVASAAVLWGSLGIAGRVAFQAGVQPLEAAFYRAAIAFVVLLGLTARTHPGGLRVRAGDLPLFAAYGLVSFAAFFFVYLYAIRETSVATAAILLYTAPAFVVLLSAALFHERLTGRTLAAVALAFAGCVLVVGGRDLTALRVPLPGALAGLAAGLTYALYSIFGKIALSRYPPAPTLTYALGFGTLALGTAALATGQVGLGHPPRAWAALAYLAVGATAAPQLLYLAGLRSLHAGRASLIATVEPVVAAALGLLILKEPLQPSQVAGGLLVLSAVWLSRPRRPAGGGG